MTSLSKTLVAVALAAPSLIPAIASGQDRADVFTSPLRRNPFATMTLGRTAMTGSFEAELANNTLSVTDVWAINQIGEDLRLSDIFLVGGLIPEGEGMRMAARTGAQGTMAFPIGRGAIALVSGVRALAQSHMPDEVASFARNGFSGDTIYVPLDGLSASTVQYAHAGLLGMTEITPASARARVRVGAGVHMLHGIGTSALSFRGTEPSFVSMSSDDSVTANVTMRSPLEFARQGGRGMAFDVFAGLDLGTTLSVNAMVLGLGTLNVASGSEEVRRLSMRGTAFDFVERMESITPDTVASSSVRVKLPAVARVEGSVRILENTRFGLGVQRELSAQYAMEPTTVTALMHYDVRRWLPLQIGASGGGRYGISPFVGTGLHFGHLRLDGELGFRGGDSPDAVRGLTMRSAMSILF